MKNILIIDDDEIIREVLVKTVSLNGYNAKGAENGKVAQKLMEQTTFNLIITDLIMPEKEGFSIIRDIKAKNSSFPIIVISGGGLINADVYLPRAKYLGANYTFKKPVSPDQLIAAIKNLIG